MNALREEFQGYATAFACGNVQADIAASHLLDRKRLDYSVESLQAVDEYLERLRASDESLFDDEEYGNAIVRAGAYLGEVVRQSARKKLDWMTYEDFQQLLPEVSERVPRKDTTRWVLCEPQGSVLTPIETVMRMATEGGIHLYPFVSALLQHGL